MDSVKRTAELLLPGASVGVIAAGVVGGVALFGGLPAGYAVTGAVAIGLPLALFGAGYGWLLATGRVRLGGVAPAVGLWLVGYIVARTIHEVALDVYASRPVVFPGGVVSFLVFQALVSVGFAVGFVWLHEHTAPLWWVRIRDRNPVAAAYVAMYSEQAARLEQRKEEAKKQRKDGQGKQEKSRRPAVRKQKSQAPS